MKRKSFTLVAGLILSILVGSAVTARMGRAQTGDTAVKFRSRTALRLGLRVCVRSGSM